MPAAASWGGRLGPGVGVRVQSGWCGERAAGPHCGRGAQLRYRVVRVAGCAPPARVRVARSAGWSRGRVDETPRGAALLRRCPRRRGGQRSRGGSGRYRPGPRGVPAVAPVVEAGSAVFRQSGRWGLCVPACPQSISGGILWWAASGAARGWAGGRRRVGRGSRRAGRQESEGSTRRPLGRAGKRAVHVPGPGGRAFSGAAKMVPGGG